MAGLILAATVFGGVVVFKSVLLKRKQGDLGCFVRAGWAVRQGGGPLYEVMCDSHWHYNYPPLFAILMTPLADPPHRDAALTAATLVGLQAGPAAGPLLAAAAAPASPAPYYPSGPYYLPYPVSVVVFYLGSLALLCVAAHRLAGLLESLSPAAADPLRAWVRYWRWRLIPVLVCVPVVGLTLVRGQVQTLLLLLVVGVVFGAVRGRVALAGGCIGAAACLKLFPAFLFVLPLWRRDLRGLAAGALAMVVGLVVVPALVLGPGMTARVYTDFAKVLVLPGLGLGGSSSRATELTDAAATQSQAIQVILLKTVYLRASQLPPQPEAWMKAVHWAAGAAMTLTTLLFMTRRRDDGLSQVAGVGMLALVMVLMSPVCHLHYFTVGLPVVAAVLARLDLDGRPWPKHVFTVLFAAMVAAWSVPMIPGLGVLRNVGVPLAGGLALWASGLYARMPARQAGAAAHPRAAA
jgi:hypothetical protein